MLMIVVPYQALTERFWWCPHRPSLPAINVLCGYVGRWEGGLESGAPSRTHSNKKQQFQVCVEALDYRRLFVLHFGFTCRTKHAGVDNGRMPVWNPGEPALAGPWSRSFSTSPYEWSSSCSCWCCSPSSSALSSSFDKTRARSHRRPRRRMRCVNRGRLGGRCLRHR